MEQKNFTEAHKHVNLALNINPKCVIAHTIKGEMLTKKGDHQGALLSYENASKANPIKVEPHYQTGLIKEEIGDIIGSLEAYRMAIQCQCDFIYAIWGVNRCSRVNSRVPIITL